MTAPFQGINYVLTRLRHRALHDSLEKRGKKKKKKQGGSVFPASMHT